jgi:hypothetical protein
MTIYGVEIKDIEVHRDKPVEHQEGIFAHLSYYDKKEAVKQLNDALSAPKAEAKKG